LSFISLLYEILILFQPSDIPLMTTLTIILSNAVINPTSDEKEEINKQNGI